VLICSPKPQEKEELGQAVIDAFPLLRCGSGSGFVSLQLSINHFPVKPFLQHARLQTLPIF